MAKKGTQNNPPRKTVQIPADIRALGSAGTQLQSAIRSHWDNLRREMERKGDNKTI